jgi:hypothetical protein
LAREGCFISLTSLSPFGLPGFAKAAMNQTSIEVWIFLWADKTPDLRWSTIGRFVFRTWDSTASFDFEK